MLLNFNINYTLKLLSFDSNNTIPHKSFSNIINLRQNHFKLLCKNYKILIKFTLVSMKYIDFLSENIFLTSLGHYSTFSLSY